MYIAMYILFPSNLSSKHCAPFSEGGVSGGSIGLPGFVHKSPRVLTSGLPLLLDLKPVRRRAVAWLLPPPPYFSLSWFLFLGFLSFCLSLFVCFCQFRCLWFYICLCLWLWCWLSVYRSVYLSVCSKCLCSCTNA